MMGEFAYGLIVSQAAKRGADNGGNTGNENSSDTAPFGH